MRKLVGLVLLVVAVVLPSYPPNSDDEIFLYRAVEKVAPGLFPLNQGNFGSCVAFGHAAGCDVLLALECVTGKSRQFLPVSPDSLYAGSRNEAYQRISGSHRQGSSGYGATLWLNKYGGVLFQKPYPEFNLDLSSYSISRTADWGATGNGGRADGLNGPLDKEAAKHPIQSVALVKTLEELDTALKNGYPVTICSGQGFTKVRDKDGFCEPSGRWSHCMVCVGKRNGGRKGYLILNSWGKYLKGPKYLDQPEGSFYVEADVIARMLRAGDSWALGDIVGFPPRLLPDWLLTASATIPADAPTPDPIKNESAMIEAPKPQPAPVTTTKVQTYCINGRCYRRR